MTIPRQSKADKTFGPSLEAFAKGKWDRAAALAVAAYDDVQRAGAHTGTAKVKDSHDRFARKSASASGQAWRGELATPGKAPQKAADRRAEYTARAKGNRK